LAGEVRAVIKAMELAKAKGAKRVVMLSVSAPFHCSLLKPAADNLAKELENVTIKDIKIPVISNVNADFVSEGNKVKELLIKQVNSPVLWEDCIKKMINSGVDTFVEVGPGKALSSFVKKIDKTLKVSNVEDTESFYKTIKNLGG
jgi:[acyl-carrier-protein] S-malonyltransferase